MFKIGDKVVDAYRVGNDGVITTGIVRGHHRGHYLVQWEKKPKWRWGQYSCEAAEDLLPADSPAIPLLLDISKKKAAHFSELNRLHAEMRAIIESARGKRTRRTKSVDQDSRSN